MRSLAAVAFLLSSAGLIVASLLVPGYIRPDWAAVFLAAGVVCVLLAAVIRAMGVPTPWMNVVIVVFGDLAIVMSGFASVDREGTTAGALLALPTLYVAMFMGLPALAVQIGLTAAGALTIVTLAPAAAPVDAIRTLVLVVASSCPAALVFALRGQLDRALAHSRGLATHDPLTGLLNRRGLDEQVPALLARARRAGTPLGVLVSDVDHFKQVNDAHGHAVGDEVLRTVAAATRDCAGEDDLVVRLGGEEIAVVASMPPAGLVSLAEQIRRCVGAAGAARGVTVSLGVAWGELPPVGTPGEDGELLWSLLDEADDRMYEAKRGGRDRVALPGTARS